jgi:hypothetical protein
MSENSATLLKCRRVNPGKLATRFKREGPKRGTHPETTNAKPCDTRRNAK